jgi:CubicO group peptidase (beta-lactamase class C family)
MKKIILTALMAMIIMPTIAQKLDKRLKNIENDLEAVLSTWNAVGFGVAIVEKDKIVYAKGFGYKDLENKIPATENTLFAIGSSTKAFTSAVLGKLRADDKIDFNKSPREYLPELKFFNDDMNNNIIVKDLMSHRTGLPRHDYSWYLTPSDDMGELLKRIEHQEPFTGIRQQWYYNNFMFMTQGLIAERLTGKPWKDNVRDMFFAPLGMTTSNLSIPELEKSTDISFGYQTTAEGENKKMDYYKIRGMAPAGSINSSVKEMSNWLITWINGGKFNDEQIIPAAYVNEATSSHMVVSGGRPGEENPDLHMANYGYGWFLSSYRGHYRVEHGGNIDGFSANVAYFPSDSIGIVVLVNQDGSGVPNLVRNIVADRMLALETIDWNGNAKKTRDEQLEAQEKVTESTDATDQVKGTKSSHILQEYIGTYSHPGYGEFNMVVKNDSLFAEFEVLTLYLRHYHYDIFESFQVDKGDIDTSSPSQLRLSFDINSAGDISGLKAPIEPTLDPIQFKRSPAALALEDGALDIYVGEYELGPQTVKVYTKNNNTLFLLVPGQPEYEMIPTDQHKFTFKTLDGFKIEFLLEAAKVVAASFIQPNGTFKATKK